MPAERCRNPDTEMMAYPPVTIVMPALNEEAYIETAIRSILPSPALECELLVVDGGSTDRTVPIVRQLMSSDARIRIVHNEKRIQSAAVNLGAAAADPRSRCIVRADCHSHYPPGFVEGCVASLVRQRAASVVVPMRTIGRSPMQRAIAAAQNSRIGNGGSPHRLAGRSGLVEHGHHAAFDRQTFLTFGGYDERFRYNEDAELDVRLTRAGRRIYLDAAQAIEYYPRATLKSLARQYYRFGWGRASTVLKHRVMPRARQAAPVLLLLALVGALGLAVLDPRMLAVPLAYLAAMVGWGGANALGRGEPHLVLMGPAAVVMHMTWAIGFVVRVLAQALPGLATPDTRTVGAAMPPSVDAGRKAGRPAASKSLGA